MRIIRRSHILINKFEHIMIIVVVIPRRYLHLISIIIQLQILFIQIMSIDVNKVVLDRNIDRDVTMSVIVS